MSKELGELLKDALKQGLNDFENQNCIPCETHLDNGKIEYGISFKGINPKKKDYFKLKNEKQAFRLAERINKL